MVIIYHQKYIFTATNTLLLALSYMDNLLLCFFAFNAGMGISLFLWKVDPIYRLRTIKTPTGGPELAPLKEKEVKRLVHIISNLCGLTNKETSVLLIISERILSIWKNSGVKFSIQYLSESLRLICNFIAGEGAVNNANWVDNHLIMYCSALRIGLKVEKGTGLYAILGDDVAISRGDLAMEYNSIMRLLGVEINPIKGFTGRILEFAKNLFHVSGTNLSPISMKVILRASRDPIYIVPLINDYINKGYWIILNTTLSNLIKLLESTHSMSVAQSNKWLFSILGPQSGFWSYSESNAGYAAWQVLFEQFLDLRVGISLTDVTRWYYKVLWNKSSYPLSSVFELGEGYLRIGKFSQKPWIWSPKKFENSVKLPSPEYMAGLTSASGMVILLPVLLYYYLSALLVGILLAFVSKITGSKGLDKELIKSFQNPLESLIGEIVGRIFDFSGRAKAFQVINTPHEGVFTNIGWFQGWVSTMRIPRPMQLLNTRFKREMKSIDDDMPAVVTAERCLSANSKVMARYYNSVRKTRRLEEQIRKIRKQGKPKNR